MPSCNIMNCKNKSYMVVNFLDIYDRGYANEHNHVKISDYIRKNYYDKFPCDNLLIFIHKKMYEEDKIPKYWYDFLLEMVKTYDTFYLEYNG